MSCQPDATSRAYAAIIPTMRRYGWAMTVSRSPYDGPRLTIRVSGRPTTRVLNDGAWERDDGRHGRTPWDLLDLYARERATLARRHLAMEDWRGVAGDLLAAHGIPATRVDRARPEGGTLHVEYRDRHGLPETIRFDDWRGALDRLLGKDLPCAC